jgi:hypothetical protein
MKLMKALYGEAVAPRPSGTSMVPFAKMYKGAVFSNDTSPLMHYGPTDGFGSTSQSFGTRHGYSKGSKFSDEQREPIPVEDYADFFDVEKRDRDLVASVEKTTQKILGINAKAK